MSSCYSSRFQELITFFFISVILLLIYIPTTASKTAFSSCSVTEFLDGSPYYINRNNLLDSLVNKTTSTGFFNTSIGLPPDVIYGFALCRGDLTPVQCQKCLVVAATDATTDCPNKRKAATWYDSCRIRYSDEPFFSSLTENVEDPYYYSLTDVPNPDLFKFKIGKLLKDLVDIAAYGANSRMFAAASINYTNNSNLYGMVQCTRDLSDDQCSQCLDAPVAQVICCQDSSELTFLGGSCYLKYSMQLFYNASYASPPSTSEDISVGTGSSNSKVEKKKSTAALVFIIIGVAVLALALAIFAKTKMKTKPRHLDLTLGRNPYLPETGGLKFHRLSSKKVTFFHSQRSSEAPVNESQKLDLQTMKMATENFSDSKRLGRGEFGPVYKGDIHGREFVVKRLTGRPQVGLEEIRRELKSIKQVQHPNLVRLLAYHIEEQEKLLVYEYLPNTSLDRILFDPKKRILLDWGRRYKIIEGIGKGLLHLHEESGLNIIHQNLKASNILLDKNMTPKISDSCLAKLFVGSQTQGGTRRTVASQGYMENVTDGGHGPLSVKGDVFSYGVLVLEIVTGQRNRDFLGSENTTNLLSYVWQYWREEKALQVLDWSLGELYKAHEVLRCIHIGLLCVQDDQETRPNISTVVHMLNSYSFTLPSPSVPSITRVRKASGSDPPPRIEGTGGYEYGKVSNPNNSGR